MYDPDENDYERLQNQWNPEDPGIIMEERYASIYDNSENYNENEADNQYYRNDNDMPPIPVYESWEDCQAKTKRDPFLKVIKAYQKKITN